MLIKESEKKERGLMKDNLSKTVIVPCFHFNLNGAIIAPSTVAQNRRNLGTGGHYAVYTNRTQELHFQKKYMKPQPLAPGDQRRAWQKNTIKSFKDRETWKQRIKMTHHIQRSWIRLRDEFRREITEAAQQSSDIFTVLRMQKYNWVYHEFYT